MNDSIATPAIGCLTFGAEGQEGGPFHSRCLPEHIAKNDLEAVTRQRAERAYWQSVPQDRIERRCRICEEARGTGSAKKARVG